MVLLLMLGSAQVYFTMQSSMRFMREADQKLNLHLARNMATELQPFVTDTLSLPEIEDKIHYMMVLNPKIEIYLLDQQGKILAFFADPKKKVKKQFVELAPIRQFLAQQPSTLILGDDPRQPGTRKPFSAAPLSIGGVSEGYLYIILGSELYDNAAQMLSGSYIVQTTLKALLITFLFTGVLGLVLFAFLTRRLRNMSRVVTRFEKGNLAERIPMHAEDELGQLAMAFNRMADTISANLEQLQQTDKLRRELIANISHDLRSPLASMQGYLETILIKGENLSPAERRKFLEITLSNTQLLNQLVEELFELSKLDARQVTPKPEIFSLAELVQDVVLKFQPQAAERQIHLKAMQASNLPLIRADIGLIERVITNLIKNALQYTGPGGTVKVALSKSQDQVRVTVSDTGCGIPQEDLPYIFDRFYRAEKSRSREKGNTGLGLAIAKKILELYNSEIFVSSEVNVGSKFYFFLKTASQEKNASVLDFAP